MRRLVASLLLGTAIAGCGTRARPPHATLLLVPLGRVSSARVETVRATLARTYRMAVVVGARRPLPHDAYYPPRHRYRAERLDAALEHKKDGDLVLGLADVDISTSAHGVEDWGVAGLATGRAAVASSFRAKDRLDEVAVHEVGHTLGLPHCPNAGCVMQDAKGMVSRIGTRFCPECCAKITTWLR